MYRILAATALLAVAQPVHAQCSDADRRALQAFDTSWGEATTSGNRSALMAMFADDYYGFTASGSQGKTAAIDAAVLAAERARSNPLPAPNVTMDGYNIACTPTTATITHRNTVTAMVDGKERISYSRSVHFLEKRGGAWRVVSNAGHALDDAGMLAYMEQDWNNAVLNRDFGWMERSYASDATEVSSRTGALETKSQLIASARADRTTLSALNLSDLSVRVEGNTAIVTGVNHVLGRTAEGRAIDERVRFTDVFIKRDGRWQIWATQGTKISPP